MKDLIMIHKDDPKYGGEYVLKTDEINSISETKNGSILYMENGGIIQAIEKPRMIYAMIYEDDIEEDKGLYIKIYALNSSQDVAEKLYQMYGANFLEEVREYLVEYIEARKEECEDE